MVVGSTPVVVVVLEVVDVDEGAVVVDDVDVDAGVVDVPAMVSASTYVSSSRTHEVSSANSAAP